MSSLQGFIRRARARFRETRSDLIFAKELLMSNYGDRPEWSTEDTDPIRTSNYSSAQDYREAIPQNILHDCRLINDDDAGWQLAIPPVFVANQTRDGGILNFGLQGDDATESNWTFQGVHFEGYVGKRMTVDNLTFTGEHPRNDGTALQHNGPGAMVIRNVAFNQDDATPNTAFTGYGGPVILKGPIAAGTDLYSHLAKVKNLGSLYDEVQASGNDVTGSVTADIIENGATTFAAWDERNSLTGPRVFAAPEWAVLLGTSRGRRPVSRTTVTVSSNTIDAEAEMMYVNGEGGSNDTIDTINNPTDAPMRITLMPNGAEDISLSESDNIRCAGGQTLTTSIDNITLQYRPDQSKWLMVGRQSA